MKVDKIIGEAGCSSRLPATVKIPFDWDHRAIDDAERFGADG